MLKPVFPWTGPHYMGTFEDCSGKPQSYPDPLRLGQCLHSGRTLAKTLQGFHFSHYTKTWKAFLFYSKVIQAYCASEHHWKTDREDDLQSSSI